MQTAIISLLVVGFLLFISTFFMKSQHKENEEHEKESEKMTFTKEEKQSLIENASIEIVEITQDKIEDAKDELEKISNEKLMAVGEFSDTVLGEMDKTHKEIMFLYNRRRSPTGNRSLDFLYNPLWIVTPSPLGDFPRRMGRNWNNSGLFCRPVPSQWSCGGHNTHDIL